MIVLSLHLWLWMLCHVIGNPFIVNQSLNNYPVWKSHFELLRGVKSTPTTFNAIVSTVNVVLCCPVVEQYLCHPFGRFTLFQVKLCKRRVRCLHNSNLTKRTKLSLISHFQTGTHAGKTQRHATKQMTRTPVDLQTNAKSLRSADERQVCLRRIYHRWNTANYSQHNHRYEIHAHDW